MAEIRDIQPIKPIWPKREPSPTGRGDEEQRKRQSEEEQDGQQGDDEQGIDEYA